MPLLMPSLTAIGMARSPLRAKQETLDLLYFSAYSRYGLIFLLTLVIGALNIEYGVQGLHSEWYGLAACSVTPEVSTLKAKIVK